MVAIRICVKYKKPFDAEVHSFDIMCEHCRSLSVSPRRDFEEDGADDVWESLKNTRERDDSELLRAIEMVSRDGRKNRRTHNVKSQVRHSMVKLSERDFECAASADDAIRLFSRMDKHPENQHQ